MDNNFYMNYEESQDYITKRGFDIPWNDCDVFVDERDITRTVANVLKWADKTMINKACNRLESVLKSYLGYYEVADFVDTFRKAMEE